MLIDVGNQAMVPISSIIIKDRAREEMGDLNDLEDSLKEVGLIQPLAVKRLDGDKYQLLGGERRFRVLSKNCIDNNVETCNYSVPVRIYNEDIDDLEAKIIEKSENFYRKDFEYWEYDKIVAEIHELRQQKHGAKPPGPSNQGWGIRDTSEVVGLSPAAVTTAIKRNRAREDFPELFANCKTQQDATKVLSKMSEAVVKEELARKIESERVDSTLVRLAKNFIIGDFFEEVKKIPPGIIHLVEIDPPYAIDLNKKKKSERISQYNEGDYNEVDINDYQVFLANTFKECYRVMADHSWLICWFGPEPWFDVVFRELNNAGFYTTRMCGIWTKPTGQTMQPNMYLANSYEMFFYAWKGRPALNRAGHRNVFEASPVAAQKKCHPTERPIQLMYDIYDTFAFTGSRVLIPFLGSGNGLLAAHKLGMSATGFELSKAYKDSFLVKVNNLN